jgi:small subunit ribosomal protein S1
MAMAPKKYCIPIFFNLDDFCQKSRTNQHELRLCQRSESSRGKHFQLHRSDGALIDIGGKSPPFLTSTRAKSQRLSPLMTWLLLTPSRRTIIGDQNAEGQVTVSIRQLEERLIWDDLKDMQKTKSDLQVRCWMCQ